MNSPKEHDDNHQLNVPVLLIMFNRPEQALKVFERIKKVRPKALYLAVDGPRVDHPNDEKLVAECQSLQKIVDWPCNVKTLYRSENLGCRNAVSCAITWFFEHEEAGIILEDDCLPDVTFFDYCHVLLNKYMNEPKVMHIGGANLFNKIKWGNDSYFFSKIAHVWGWATWRRAWAFYDVTMKAYPNFKHSGQINEVVSFAPSRSYWTSSFDNTYSGLIDTWDYQWVFTIWYNKGLSIIPNQNLVSNIGFGESATHTLYESEFSNLPTFPINISQIVHPKTLEINDEATNYAYSHFYQLPSWWRVKIGNAKNYLKRYKF